MKNVKQLAPTLPLDLDSIKDYRKRSKILIFSAISAGLIVGLKAYMHKQEWEPIGFSSIYSTIITGGFFVLGFLLSATIADYKESEKIPSEFSAVIENMFVDARSIATNYPKFDIEKFRVRLIEVLLSAKDDLVNANRQARYDVHGISTFFAEMEKADVPPNFITKLKQEQAQLIRMLFRAYYIQTIKFIPSALILARMIVLAVVGLLLLTDLEPASASLWLIGAISFIMIYVIRLIRTISKPFRKRGSTKDDVSMYLIDRAIDHLEREAVDDSRDAQ